VVEGKYTSPILIVGDEGVGRKFAVRQFLKESFCTETRADGCTCYDCDQIDQWNHPDVSTVPDFHDKKEGSEIRVEPIRSILQQSPTFPSIAPFRLLLVDGADRMNATAANAILKTLEEPPSHVRFILLAEHLASVLPTIQSRCGIVHFRPLPESFVLTRVSREQSDPTKALVYTRMGEGSVGRSLAYAIGGKLSHRDKVYSMIESGLRKDLPSIFSILETVKADLPLVLRILEQLTHDILMANQVPDRLIHCDLTEGLKKIAGKAGKSTWQKLAQGTHSLRSRLSTSINVQFHVQTLFVETFWV
jgi:DNA polymerase-3 subunit delta'